MSTLKDVARQAGVSVTTASHALNKTRFVQPATAERVLTAARELAYSPNRIARGLRMGRSTTIGVIGPSALDPFFAEVVRGIEETCYKRDYDVYLGYVEYPGSSEKMVLSEQQLAQERRFVDELLSGNFRAPLPEYCVCDSSKELSLVEKLLAREVDGLILNPAHSDASLAEALSRVEAETLIFHSHFETLGSDEYSSDDYSGTAEALRRLIALGHRRIGMVYGCSWQSHSARDRYRAYFHILREAGLELDPRLVQPGLYSLDGAAEATRKLLSLQSPPTAIVYWSDPMAISAMDAAREMGVVVPRDLSIVGFDDLDISSRVAPRLSSISQQKFEAGVAMTARLIDRIERALEGPSEQITSPTRFVERESVGPCNRTH